MRCISTLVALLFFMLPSIGGAGEAAIVAIRADPTAVQLRGPTAVHSILVDGKTNDGQWIDLTGSAGFVSLAPDRVTVDSRGYVRGLKDGSARVEVRAAGQTVIVVVQVEGSSVPRRFNFANDIVPLFSRFGCNSSGCHGKAEGQNGFKLSVFGFDPQADYAALTRESRGRRVQIAAPEQSLLLRKMSGQMAHGGGARIPAGTSDYETIRAWIAAGMPPGSPSDPHVISIRVEPRERLLAMHSQQQLRVMAKYSDGREADVTLHSKFQTNNEALATVNATGTVQAGEVPGDVAIMASYMNCVDVFRAFVPRGEKVKDYPALAENNFIDHLAFAKLRKLNIVPSEPADDAEFLRRVYLDVIGTLPTVEDCRRFLGNDRASGIDQRGQLVNELLKRPEYADYWALKWSDLLRVDRQALGPKRALAYYQWIRASFAADKPMDQFARELVTVDGPGEGPAGFYRVVSKSGEMASTVSQVLLGVRIACAQCHHHPFDRWSQDDYYGMQAFFAQVTFRPTPQGEALVADGDPLTKNPRSGETIPAHALGTNEQSKPPAGDRRMLLADWLTRPENPWFARNIANRVWAHFMGRGLVEPVDDVRSTNPPSDPELLDALARYLVENKYDVQKLIRLITTSKVYQLSSRTNATNEKDEQNYSRAQFRRVEAEVLLDMVSQATGVPEKFEGAPECGRAIQLWDSKVSHYFLKVFGRPTRVSVCECERNHEPGVAQVLHLLNSPEINGKLAHDKGTVARLVREKSDDGALVEDMYLTFFSRYPTTAERGRAVAYLKKDPAKRRQAAEDLAWSLLNSLEFVFNH